MYDGKTWKPISIGYILSSSLSDTEKVTAIQELKNEVDMAMMLS